MKQYVKRVLQGLTGFSTLWFFYWLFINEMVVWQKPYPTSLTNFFLFTISLVLFATVSWSRLLSRISGLRKREGTGEKRSVVRRVLQGLTGLSTLWFFYWLFINEMVV